METIVGTVHKVLWSAPEEDNHYKVFRLRKKGNEYETVTGDFEELIEGAEVEIHGLYSDHPRYGKGFKAKAHVFTFNKDSTYSISLYLQSITKFLGPKRAYAIAHMFGSDLENVIEKDCDKLLEVEDVGPQVVKNLVEAWYEHREEKNVRIFLHSLGLSEKQVKRILASVGIDAETKIKENPYLLCLFGFGFSTCDYIAKKLKLDPKSPVRIKYFIIYLLKETRSNGHLFLKKPQIVHLFNSYNERTDYHFKAGEIVAEDLVESLEELKKDAYIVEDDGKFYDIDYFFFENESARILSMILKKEDLCTSFRSLNVETFINSFEKKERVELAIPDFALSDDQKDAIRSFIKEKILIVTGSPGTGKTTVLKSFVDLMVKFNISFELLSPTGIAAKKLGNTAGYEAYTIHRRLGYQGSSWGYNAHNKYNTEVVIVDEMSMVDMEVFYRLVSALYTSTKIVLVGDNDQLPSVGPGRVLNELIESKVFKTIQLRNIFRQAEQSDIIKEAKKIKDGDIDLTLFKSEQKADIWFIRNTSSHWIEQKIVEFSKGLKQSIKEKGKSGTFQIITPRNSGPLSVETLNNALQSALNPRKPEEREIKLKAGTILRVGDRVLIKKNNYNLDVFNGDIGKIVAFVKADILIDIDDFHCKRRIEVPMEQADEMLKLGYSLTVHKAQGNEYDIVLLPIVKSHGKKILQRNLLYTAITRSKKKVIVFGQGGALVDAIENDKIQERNTRLADRTRQWTQGEGITLQQLFSGLEDCQNAETLKRLLLSEEKIFLEKVTVEPSPQEEADLKEMNTEPLKVARSTRQSSKPLTALLEEVEELAALPEPPKKIPRKKRKKKLLKKNV